MLGRTIFGDLLATAKLEISCTRAIIIQVHEFQYTVKVNLLKRNARTMTPSFVFVDRRVSDRRFETDPCRHLPLDLCNQRRRKAADRRSPERRSTEEDREAYMQSALASWEPPRKPNTDVHVN